MLAFTIFRSSIRSRTSQTTLHSCSRLAFSTTVTARSTVPVPLYGEVGVAKAVQAPPTAEPTPTIFAKDFSLADRVALVTGANRGIGLEMALALVEAGARSVYCVDLPKEPGDEWTAVSKFAQRLKGTGGEGRLEYISCDVTDQEAMWKVGKTIGDREGRMDVGIAAAGILNGDTPCLTYPEKQFKRVLNVNVNGVLHTAQAAGQQMERFGNGGSIIMITSTAGHVANKGTACSSYNTSKSAVLQLARSMACELGPQRIRVNTISPSYLHTDMLSGYLLAYPQLEEAWGAQHPLGRIGRPHELRGAAVFLASDASSFCTGSDVSVNGGYTAW